MGKDAPIIYLDKTFIQGSHTASFYCLSGDEFELKAQILKNDHW